MRSGQVMWSTTTDTSNTPVMMDLERYRVRVKFRGLAGLSEIGFKRREVPLGDLFPTADKVLLSMKGYFHKLGESASVIYETANMRFDVVENNQLLELAVPNPRGGYAGLIIDILSRDITDAYLMMEDIEKTCGFVRARLREAMGIMEISEDEYVERLRYSARLLANELRS